jgi:hypothetical protein
MRSQYDTDPVPVSYLLQELEESKRRGREDESELFDAKQTETKDPIVHRGPYKPWFHSRFARSRVSLPRNACAADLKRITDSSPSFETRPDKGRQKRKCKSDVLKSTSKHQNNTTTSGAESDQEELSSFDHLSAKARGASDTWVECDECGKWRKIPRVDDINLNNPPILFEPLSRTSFDFFYNDY